MRFNSILFVLDRKLVGVPVIKGRQKEISLEKLPKVPLIPSYYHLEESTDAADEVLKELRPYVKGFFRKQAVLICMPDDAPVYVDQKYMRNFMIRRGAGTNTTVRTLESLLLARSREYVAISRSERLLTVTYRRGQSQPKRAYLPLSLANFQTVELAIKGLSPEIEYNQPDVYIIDPDKKLKDYYGLGERLYLEDLAELAQSLSEKNWL